MTRDRPAPLDVGRVRAQFPILSTTAHGRPLVYLDSAATTQKPQSVIDALTPLLRARERQHPPGRLRALGGRHRDVRRGARADGAVHQRRVRARGDLHARHHGERQPGGAGVGRAPRSGTGDEIVVTEMEHHSNIVPWQLVAAQRGAVVRAVPVNEAGELDLDAFQRLLTKRTRMVAVVHLSNALGTINPVRARGRAGACGRRAGAGGRRAVGGAPAGGRAGRSAATSSPSRGHKLFGPTGIGVLYGREALLDRMPPWQGGGRHDRNGDGRGQHLGRRCPPSSRPARRTSRVPWAFTTAIDFLAGLDRGDRGRARARPAELRHRAAVGTIPGVRLIGTAREKASVLSFTVEGVHPHDLGTVLDADGICDPGGAPLCPAADAPVRPGGHGAGVVQPLQHA